MKAVMSASNSAGHATLQLLSCQFGEPSFDLVDPTGRCGGEVNVPVRAAGQPRLDFRRLVRGVIVHHQMYVRPFRNRGVDLFQKVEELGRPVALVAFADHRASRDVERGKQRCRSMADVGMGSPLGGDM